MRAVTGADSPDSPAPRRYTRYEETYYMRPLPAADAMRDIDMAPLNEPDTGAMTPAAVAWLRQHLAQHSSTLPAQHNGPPVPRH